MGLLSISGGFDDAFEFAGNAGEYSRLERSLGLLRIHDKDGLVVAATMLCVYFIEFDSCQCGGSSLTESDGTPFSISGNDGR